MNSSASPCTLVEAATAVPEPEMLMPLTTIQYRLRCAIVLVTILACALFATGGAHAADLPQRYQRFAITQPKDGVTVFSNPGHVDVRVAIEPAAELAAGERLVLLLDGQEVAQVRGQEIVLDNVNRGTHELRARIVDSDGATIAEAPPVTFHMWQASRNFPSRR